MEQGSQAGSLRWIFLPGPLAPFCSCCGLQNQAAAGVRDTDSNSLLLTRHQCPWSVLDTIGLELEPKLSAQHTTLQSLPSSGGEATRCLQYTILPASQDGLRHSQLAWWAEHGTPASIARPRGRCDCLLTPTFMASTREKLWADGAPFSTRGP